MAKTKPSALKKLSDKALRKRLDDLEKELRESSTMFADETKRLFGSIEKDLRDLSDMDIPARLEPIFREGEEQLDSLHEEFLQVIERETKAIEEAEHESEEEASSE